MTLVFEGEEEVGSPHLRQFTNGPRGKELLQADACIWEAGYKDPAGRPTIALGCKGILYVELRARSASKDLHSSWGAAVDNAAWRLTLALSTLRDASGRVLIPGFYDRVATPSERLLALSDRGLGLSGTEIAALLNTDFSLWARTAGALDPASRTLRTEVSLPNASGELLAGMFVQVSLDVAISHQVVRVPSSAIIADSRGVHVAVVDGKGKVHLTAVMVGPDNGSTVDS